MNVMRVRRGLLFLMLFFVIAGCAGTKAFQDAERLAQEGRYEEAVAGYAEAVSKKPHSHEYRMRLQAVKNQAALQHLRSGREFLETGDYKGAAVEFRAALSFDPSIETAGQELKRTEELLRSEALIAEGEGFFRARRFSQAKRSLKAALLLDPGNLRARKLLEKVKGEGVLIDGIELDVASDKPITLKFKDAEIRKVFDILSTLSGINFIFDEDIRSGKVSVFLEEATFAQALEFLLQMHELEKRVLNAKTIIVYPRTKEKEKKFKDQIIQTFYLSNIEAKKAVNLLRTMLQLRKIYVHEELNALVIRDTSEVIKLASQVLENADRADSEVVFDLELVEVSHGNTLNLGPRLSTYSTSVGLSKDGSGKIVDEVLKAGGSTDNLVSGLDGLETFYTLPTATFDFAKTLTDSEVLANPKIRVKNKEKAKVHIGTREPVITVTQNGDTFTDNIQYVDVGVKLDVEPVIQLDNTVVTKLALEVSSVSDRQTTDNGSVALTITTTNAQTALSLKDGERTIIGGLIRDNISNSRKGFPILGDIPLLGPLLTNYDKTKGKREILLSITPHIVKSVELPAPESATIWSGGEDDLKAGSRFASFAAPLEPESEQLPPAIAPGITPGIEAPAPPVAEPAPAAEPEPAIVEPPAPVKAETPLPVPAPFREVVLPATTLPSVEIGGRAFLAGPKLVGVDEVFTVTVSLDAMENLYSAPLFVNYDSKRLEFVRAEEGKFLGRRGQATIFTSSVHPEQNRVIIGYKQGVGGNGASGAGNLFSLVFKGISPGPSEIALERINFRNPQGKRLPVSKTGLTLEVR